MLSTRAASVTMTRASVLVIAALMLPATAEAQPAKPKPVKQYVLKRPKREHCKAHYVKKISKVKKREHGRTVKFRETFCVYVAPKKAAATAPATVMGVAAHARLDGFRQNAADPLVVTYSYSASADQLGGDVASSLPSGVLVFYSDGLLVCSLNVGGAVTSGECTVTYGSYGTHTANVVYTSGAASTTTGVESVSIEPPPVTATLGTGVRSPMDPLAVTYPVSATAHGVLPEGSLTLNASDGTSCSIPLGPSLGTGSCLIEYSTVGSHNLSLTYTAQGDIIASTSGSEQLAPFSTSTTESITPEGPLEPFTGGPGCKLWEPGHEKEQKVKCSYTVGLSTVDQYGGVQITSRSITLAGECVPVLGDPCQTNPINVVILVPDGVSKCVLNIEVESIEGRGNFHISSPNCLGAKTIKEGTNAEGKELKEITDGLIPDTAAVPKWSVVSTYAGSLGRTASHSEPQMIWTFAELG